MTTPPEGVRRPWLGPEGWYAADHPLGRGRLRPENVRAGADAVLLRLPAGSHDGAELRTVGRFGPGEFRARLRAPRAPGTLTAFFLYEDVAGGNDEVDVELFNDGSRRALLTTWRAGEQTRSEEVRLPFDPAEGPHEYTIRLEGGGVRFLADGTPLAAWRGGLPERAMRIVLNSWWPAWLAGDPLPEPAETMVDRVSWDAPAAGAEWGT